LPYRRDQVRSLRDRKPRTRSRAQGFRPPKYPQNTGKTEPTRAIAKAGFAGKQ